MAGLVIAAGLLTMEITHADNGNDTAADKNAFRELPLEEKEYSEPMNILGKTVRIFNDVICLEEYCHPGDSLPVYIDGGIGLNTKDSIKLEIKHCGHIAFGYDIGSVSGFMCEGAILATISADNTGNGGFHAEWHVRQTSPEGWYEVSAATGSKKELEVGNTMADVIRGHPNKHFLILDNTVPLQFTQITPVDATVKILGIQHEEVSGIVSYEICAKRDLQNPAFELKSDSKTEHIGHKIELKSGECHQDRRTILAKTPTSIFLPLAWSDNTEMEAQGTDSQENDGIEHEIPDWVKRTAEWWVQGLIPDEMYIQSLEYLIEVGIIRVSS